MAKTWVVFRRETAGTVGVVPYAEWAVLKAAHADRITLIRAGIASEGEAERVARQEARKRPPRPDPDEG